MSWLVSRRAYDEVRTERDLLRERVHSLEDEIIRMARSSRGMREEPRQPKGPKIEPIPPGVRSLISKFQSPAIQEWMEAEVRQMNAAGTPWEEVQKVLRMKLED